MKNTILRFAIVLAALPATAAAQVIGIALDPKPTLVNGAVARVQNPVPDSAVFFEFSGTKTKKLGQVNVPTSVVGPPSSIAVSADRSLALVSSSTKEDPNDPKKFTPNNKVSLVDLKASPISVLQTVELSASPASIAMNPEATVAIAMHTDDDSVTVMSISDKQLSIVEKVPMGKGSGPLSAVFSPGGKNVLIARGGDNKVSLFVVDGTKLRTPAIRDMSTGVRPFALSMCGNTGLAVVSNYGVGTGDNDTVSLIDLSAAAPRVVDTITVGPIPEGIGCAPDGKYAAAAIQNMSNRPKTNPFHTTHSKVVLLKIDGKRFQRLGEAPIGVWSQGVGFLDDSRTIFAQSVMDRSMHLLRIEGNTLKVAAPPIVFQEGAPVAYGVAGR